MLRHLYIKDFVLIDELHMDFHDGFSAFTGETGAGKSIFVDAISILTMDRASVKVVAKGKEKAIIEGTFDLSKDPHALSVLKEAGFDVQEETCFTKEITSNGHSTTRIDHRIVSLTLLRNCLKNQIDIHGQRDNAYLLDNSQHRYLLDQFAQDQDLTQKVADCYNVYHDLCVEKETALSQTYKQEDIDYFTYQIKELEEANLKIGEEEQLEEKEAQYKAIKNSYEKLHEIVSLYEDSVSGNLYDLNHKIQNLEKKGAFDSIQTTMNDAYFAIQEAMENLKGSFEENGLQEEDINAMEERLFTLQRLKRKYHCTIEELLQKKEELQKQMEQFANRDAYLKEINEKIDAALSAYQKQAKLLTQARKKAGTKLDTEILKHLKDLSLPKARFYTQMETGDPSIYGSDKIEFLIAMNPGEDLKSLSKTASGGELSRLMLGLKVVFTHLKGVQTIIFDEIDTGVSGPVAAMIGSKMKELSKDAQVIAITHLANVAAYAAQQYKVEKSSVGNKTTTHVRLLNEKERVEELALISSGDITPASKKAALELFKRSQA